MKKLLTILLALLVVTGVVFADDDPNPPVNATLDLKATKDFVLRHGITGTQITSGDEVGGIANASKNVLIQKDWDSTDGNTWGDPIYYTILTNTTKDVSVAVGITPLTLDTPIGGVRYYVPYTLTVGGDSFGFDDGSEGVAKPGTDAVSQTTTTALSSLATAWDNNYTMRYYNGLIGVSIDGDPVDAMEGDYSAQVTFTVTAQ